MRTPRLTFAAVVVPDSAGQDLSKYGLCWSHPGLGEFFLDDPWEYRAGYAVPAPDVQTKLHTLLNDNTSVQRLHAPDYNMLAYPWAQRYQQSNQRAIETLAAANVAFDDHPNDKRYSDRIETVITGSVFQWLERAALAGCVHAVR